MDCSHSGPVVLGLVLSSAYLSQLLFVVIEIYQAQNHIRWFH